MYPIILVYGNAGAGKDFIADKLLESGITHIEKLAFADPIKELLEKYLEFNHNELWGPSKNRDYPRMFRSNKRDSLRAIIDQNAMKVVEQTFVDTKLTKTQQFKAAEDFGFACGAIMGLAHANARIALQKLGDWGRRYDQDVWVKLCLKRIAEKLAKTKPIVNTIVISDGRFRNEILAIKMVGGVVLKVCHEDPKFKPLEHPSEQEQLTVPDWWFDVILKWSGDKIGFNKFVANYLKET